MENSDLHMVFLSRGFKNLQWYAMTSNDNPNYILQVGNVFGFIISIVNVL